MRSVADDVLRIVHAFSDKGRRDEVRAIAARVAELEAFARDVRDNFDHDEDAHRYGTRCRACAAESLVGIAS